MLTPIIKYKNVMYDDVNHDDYMIDINGNVTKRLGENSKLTDPKYLYLPINDSNQYLYVGLSVFKRDSRDPNINYFRIDELLCWFYKYEEVSRILYTDFNGHKMFEVTHINGDKTDNRIENLSVSMFIEIWKNVVYENLIQNLYQVSNLGNIRNISSGIIQKNSIDSRGYVRFSSRTMTGGVRTIKIHRLVAYTFLKNPNYKHMEVNHIDGNRTNNYVGNLEWVSEKENSEHAWLTGLNDNYGDKIGTHDVDVVRKVCELLVETGGRVINVVRAIEPIVVSESFVRHIKYKRIWKRISDEYFDADSFPDTWHGEGMHKSKLNRHEVERMCELLVKFNGCSNDVVKQMNTEGFTNATTQSVCEVKHKRRWVFVSDKYFRLKDGRFTPIKCDI